MNVRWILAVAMIATAALLFMGHEAIEAGRVSGASSLDRERPVAVLPPDSERGTPVSVPADPAADYQLIEWSRLGNGDREAVTRRAQGARVDFVRLEIDCANRLSRSRTSDTLANILTKAPLGRAAPLEQGTIAADIARHVCAL